MDRIEYVIKIKIVKVLDFYKTEDVEIREFYTFEAADLFCENLRKEQPNSYPYLSTISLGCSCREIPLADLSNLIEECESYG